MATKFDNDIPDCVKLLDRNEWAQGKPAYMAKGVTRYTNGSKMTTGIGVGIYQKPVKAGVWGSMLPYFNCLTECREELQR